MTSVICQLSVSLDGFVAGRDQSVEEPLGVDGERLHDWAFAGEAGPASDADIAARHGEGVGAYLMGRKMFGPPDRESDLDWRGWWGEDPPYHVPVFVLTHHARQDLPMDGGTVFHFVTDGIEAALEQAKDAAGDQKTVIAGGADVIRQYLNAGLVDAFQLHVVPVVLGGGVRLLDGLDPARVRVELDRVVDSPSVTHLRYRVLK
jgi:dihydrofolate reductase